MGKYQDYIGVFDSGVGGISVLGALIRRLPHENFFYFGDSANAPYGEKSINKIRGLAMNIADRMVDDGCKAIVVACNTATSAAVDVMREKYEKDIPIVSMEPALKPAAEHFPNGKILSMATPATLKLKKYHELERRLDDRAEFISAKCPGLAARIEKGRLHDSDLIELLEKLIGQYRGSIDAVVLGCTHYPFIAEQIRQVLGNVPMFDGREGTANQLARRLEERNLLTDEELKQGDIVLKSSLDTESERELYRYFFKLA